MYGNCDVCGKRFGTTGDGIWHEPCEHMENRTSKTVETKALNIADVMRRAEMISEQFEYRGFTFQRMTKDARWYVCYANQIVNWGQYRSDLKEWVDGHYA